MGCEVYANNDEIACKAGDGKVIAAFPDVCLSPPSPPAGPVPIPYPDTSFSKDMQNGSKTVNIKGKEVMLKDKSFYKTSPLGDEAATNSFGAGVMSHVITGKTYFVAWSMDVKFEGENVDRHLDLTTSNHASPMANAQAPMVNSAFMAPPGQPKVGKCECCGKRHEGQQGGIPVSEDEWYGLNEGPEIDREIRNLQNFPPHPQDKKGVAAWQSRLKQLAERDAKLQARKDAVRTARENNCKCLPEPPCNVYFVFPQTPSDRATKQSTAARKTKEIEKEWDAHRPKYKRRRPQLKSGETTHHRTPKAAGGCPTGKNNLVPDSKLSEECKKANDALTGAQDDAAKRWQETLQR